MNLFAKRRIEANLMQEEAGAALGVDRSTVAKWETGKAMPRADKFPAIAKLYGCSVGDLFTDEKPTDNVEKAV